MARSNTFSWDRPLARIACLGVGSLLGTAFPAAFSVLPIAEILDAVCGRLDAARRAKARHLCVCLGEELKDVRYERRANGEATIRLVEIMLATCGLRDAEFAEMDLDPVRAARAVFDRYDFKGTDRQELGDDAHRLLTHFYSRIVGHEEILRDLMPGIYRVMLGRMRRAVERTDHIVESTDHIAVEVAHIRRTVEALGPQIQQDKAAAEPPAIPILTRPETYILRCPATMRDYDATWSMVNRLFREDVVDPTVDRDAFVKNPFSMVVLLDRFEHLLGFIDIYHLPDHQFDALLRADKEFIIDPSDLLPYASARRARRGYIATIMVENAEPKSLGGRDHLVALIYGMIEFLLKHQFDGTDEFELYCIAYTKEGEDLMRKLDFHPVQVSLMPSGAKRTIHSRLFRKADLEGERIAFPAAYGLALPRFHLDFGDPRPELLDEGNVP